MSKMYLILFFISSIVYGQNSPEIDSLKHVTQEEKLHDSIIIKSYISLIKHYKKNNEDSCLVYLRRLKEYGDKSESNRANHYYYHYKAGYYALFLKDGEDSFEMIIANLEKALEYAQNSKDPNIIVKAFSRLSEGFYGAGNVEKALEYSRKRVAYANERGLWLDAAYAYGKMGEIYLEGYGMTETSLKYLLKSDSIYRLHEDENEDRAFTKSSIGDVYKQLGDIAEAESYQKEALLLFEENNNVYQQIYILGKLASIEREKKNYLQAIIYFEDCINYYRDNKYPVREAMYHIGLSDVYFESNQIAKAIETAQTSITLSTNLSNDFGVLLGSINKSRFLYAAKNYQESYKLAIEAKAIADEMDSYIDKKDALDLLYKSSEKLGRFEEAYNFSKEHKRVSDTLVKRQNLQQTKTLEAQYKNAQQEQEIQVLQSQNELVEEQKRNQRNLLFAIIGLVFLAGLVLFFLYRNRQKTNQKLKELDALKSNFFANISHEFRTPLTLISGPIEKQLKHPKLNIEDRKDFEMVQRNTNRLLNLVDQLLDLSKLESGSLKLRVREGNIGELLKSLAASFDYSASERGIEYKVNIQDRLAWFDKDAIEKIVINLLSNAFKYVSEGGAVRFSSVLKNDKLELQIENGGEISEEQPIEEIFNRFYQANSANDGVGIGLALVKELINLNHGTITVENTSDKSVLFTVVLPISKNQFLTDEIDLQENTESLMMNKIPSIHKIDDELLETEINSNTAILLIVDDNKDIRTFIRTSFNDQYQIVEAMNGAEGIEKAIECIPDIIISDIMMPEVDGLELCERLKNDERTSHIPIVLLTADALEETHYKGLETGADDYVLKPFKISLLQTRIKNLIESRMQLRDRYSKEVVLKPKAIAISRIDERFIEKVQAVLDEHLTDPSFSAEQFSEQLNLSRMQLHRKLKALTDMTASEFVRSQRLKLAISLLKESDINVSEICYKVGFNSPSYFTKCFKETFGCTPSEYIE